MSREKEIFNKLAKEIASEIVAKEKDPEYNMVLDKVSVIDKLSTITGRSYNETSSDFDQKVNFYIRTLNPKF